MKATQVIVRYRFDVVVAAESREAAREAIRLKGRTCLREVQETLIRGEDGWVNPAWRVTEQDGELKVDSKRRSKGGANG